MNAVISVVGKDSVGILADIANQCALANANVKEVTQSIVDDLFIMMMVCNVENLNMSFNDFVDTLVKNGEKKNLKVHVMHEDIFNSMHRI